MRGPDLHERRRRADSKLTDAQVRLLHRMHTERGVSIRELGRTVAEQRGYASAEAAGRAISRAFARLHLPARDCVESRLATMTAGYSRCEETKADGDRCESFALVGDSLCWPHRYRELARARALAVSPFARDAA